MKTKLLILCLIMATTAQAATKIATQHFEVNDSIRLLEKDDPAAMGYKFVKSVSAQWPVTINGKKSKALNEFLVEQVFYASHNRNSFPSTPADIKALNNCVKKWVHSNLRTSTMTQEYIVKEYGTPGLKDVDSEEDPMSRWYETIDLSPSHNVGNIAFFVLNGDTYYGGAHNVFGATYYAFDTALDRPIHLKDIVTNPRKVLRMLPSYDHRDKDTKWWDNVNVTDIENFFIKNGKLVFIFNPYAIGPFCDGIIEVPIPLKTLRTKGLLTPYGKKLLK